MFCQKCGAEINDEAIVCIKCGCSTEKKPSVSTDSNGPKTGLGILFALFLGLIGLIIGICLYKENTIARQTFITGWTLTFIFSWACYLILILLLIFLI